MKRSSIAWLPGGIVLALIAVFSTGKYGLWLIFILLGISFIIALYSIIRQCLYIHKTSAKENDELAFLKLISKFFILFLASGTFLYVLTFLLIGNESQGQAFFSNTELFFRSLICSFDLFLLDIDSNIIDRIDTHPALKTWIFIQAILSSLCTVSVFASLILSRIFALWKLNVKTKVTSKKNHLYLFFSLSRATELLAADISRRDPKAIIIIIDEANLDQKESNSFSNILSYFTHKRSSFEFAEKSEAVIAIANRLLIQFYEDIDVSNQDIFDYIGLPKIRKLIEKLRSPGLEDPQLHVFFLGDNEEINVQSVLNFTKDTTLKMISGSDVATTIYFHGRQNGPYSMIEEIGLKNNFDIKIVDSSRIAVDYLKSEGKYHPVNFVRLSESNPSAVVSSFNSLIIGFGEVGRDSLRFLYEFGAFLDEKSNSENSIRSPFNCIAIDPEMGRLKAGFLQTAPALLDSDSGINLRDISTNDERFFVEVLTPDNRKNLNYVIIASGNDEENINIAIKIFKSLYSGGNPMDKLKIMVRCIDSRHLDMMKKFAEFYNRTLDSENPKEIIEIFGNPESVFTFDLIVGNKFKEEAERFFDMYGVQSGKKESWGLRRENYVKNLTLESLQSLLRKEGQDFENAFHIYTKMYLLKNALGENYDWPDFLKRYFVRPDKEDNSPEYAEKNQNPKEDKPPIEIRRYPELNDEERKVILNLAMLEHLRWIASHELLGYKPCENGETYCDEKSKRHNCLVKWQYLDDTSEASSKAGGYPLDYKLYDFFVVDTTISIDSNYLLSYE